MKEHSKNARPSNWDKHTGRQKQKKEKKRLGEGWLDLLNPFKKKKK